MKTRTIFHRVLSLMLAAVLVLGYALPARATGEIPLELIQVDNSAVTAPAPMKPMEIPESQLDPNELVRVSIQLAQEPALAGFGLSRIGSQAAETYRADLQREQLELTARIEREILNGKKLDVVWNMTLAANAISANVPRGAIESIRSLEGVTAVAIENRYSPDVVTVGGKYEPDMAVSGQMTGAAQAWLEGYTGAGSLVAVIDTGLDTDHQSFDASAFEHAIAQVEAEKGVKLDLMDAADIAPVLTQLNAYKRDNSLTAEDLYINAKTAYGYNYVDGSLDVTHDNDDQGEHGSHVAGIASANRYLYKNGGFVDALSRVHVAGTAPDAQLLIMKVFGKEGGAYDSDIMVAIEDAMILGADVVNLSLGSTTAGNVAVTNPVYADLMERVQDSGMVMSASAGNDGQWAEYSTNGYLYNTDVNYDTVGVPGSYVSALAVASVDNDGLISSSLVVDGHQMGYSEALTDASGTPFSNSPIASLDHSMKGSGTDYEFIMIDGLGKAEDYAGLDLTGKIVLCSRGELYYAEKATIAAELGAAALIVYNNEPGTINMDLTDYAYSMPAVFLTKGNAEIIRAAAEKQTSKAGVTYYTGTITVKAALSGNYDNSEFKTMSSFSSWGVPGDLSLKPEITAPGGNIYSVNGLDRSGTAYELMSGTSMAAPQVSGLVAVLQQYLQENNISVPGLNARTLAQSLLMATAEPMLEGTSNSYYSVFQQGAGLADVSAAIASPVHVTVDGMADGKVKVELGDDPQRTGTYSFAFTLHNRSDAALSYAISADLFTQNIFFDDIGNGYMDTLTRALEGTTRFFVDGMELETGELSAIWDFDGDNAVTEADAQALLDHVTLGTALAANAASADLSGDGAVTTYDAHLLLKALASKVLIPANGSVTIDVTVALSDAEKARLDAETPNGAYLEAYVFASPVSSTDEVLPRLSIPVLGFYGCWTDPSMFDAGTQVTHATGEETHASYFGNNYGNALGIIYGDRTNEIWYFGGNPIVPDETYIPARNAVNIERGDRFYQWSYAPARNSIASRFTVTDGDTGELILERLGDGVDAAFYYLAYASWMNTPQYFEVGYTPDLNEDESALLELSFAPEYYVNEDGTIDWEAMGPGATLQMPITVDNAYPEILDVVVDEENQVMKVTASDNKYLAGVLLYDVTGRRQLGSAGTTADAQPGETITFEIPLDTVDGYKFIIQVADYACNMVTYKLRYTIGEPDPLPTRLAYDESFQCWSTFFVGSYGWESKEWFASDLVIQAATAIGETVLACDPDGNLYAIPVEDMLTGTFIRRLDVIPTDMAYDAQSGTVYAVDENSNLYTLDKYSGKLELVGTIGVETRSLACDGSGTFYAGHYRQDGYNYHYEVYRFTLDTIAEPQLLGDIYQKYYYQPAGIDSMEYDPVNQVIGWISRMPGYSFDESYYFEIDPATGENQLTFSYAPPTPFTKAATALVYPTWGEEANAWTAPTDIPTDMAFVREEVEVLRGYSVQLETLVYPWTLSNKAVIFSVADPTIAAVDPTGLVTGMNPGTTTVTAVSLLDNSISAQCTVTVKELEINLEGIIRDEVGKPKFFTWDLTEENYVRGQQIDTPPMAVALLPDGNSFYLLDSDDGTMHLLDRQGKDLTTPSTWYIDNNYWVWDTGYSEQFSDGSDVKLIGIRENTVLAPFSPMYPEMVNFDLSAYGVTFLTGIATAGTETVEYQGYYGDLRTAESDIFYMIDDQNRVWRCNMILEDGVVWDIIYSVIPTNMTVRYPASFVGRSSLVMGEDGALYYSAWTGHANELYRLSYDETTESYNAIHLGNFGADVWPVVILEAASNAQEATAPAGTHRLSAAPAEGSLDAVSVDQDSESQTGGITYDAENGTVTIPLMADATANGLLELRYDAEALTLVGTDANAAILTALDTSKSGVVRLGFANARSLTDAQVAKLTFAITDSTAITLKVIEDGAEIVNTEQTITLEEPFVNPFTDVAEGDFYYDSVMWAVRNGITTGATATTFNPGGQCQRAQVVTFLWRAAGSPEPTKTENPFTDVKESDFYYKAVLWAVEKGITNGLTATEFGPFALCNRAQVVTFLYRAMEKPAYSATESVFTDVTDPTAFYYDAVLWAAENGITNGMGDGTFGIGSICNRAQVVTFLYRSFLA